VLKMIDGMVNMLGVEQQEDDKKKEYCEKEFDEADDKVKSLENEMETEANNINKAKAAIATLGEEIAALFEGVKKLDGEVAEATQQRQDENSQYKDLKASNSAAKELLELAKQRLNKFYAPSAAAVQVRVRHPVVSPDAGSGFDSVADAGVALVQVAATQNAPPPPPPETFDAYSKKGEEDAGVVAMINKLITELMMDMKEAEVDENEAQKDYEEMMADAAKKRAEDSKLMADKEQVKAETEVDLEGHKAAQLSAFKEHQATGDYIASLHAECDWLMQFFSVRKEARAGEVQALKDAKAVLSGASYSLLQTRSQRRLRRGSR